MEIFKFVCGQEGGELDASYGTSVKDGYIIHRRYFTAKFAKILCCWDGSLRQQTLLCVQQLLLNMYTAGVIYNLSRHQTGIKLVIRQTFQMSGSEWEVTHRAASVPCQQTWLLSTRPTFTCFKSFTGKQERNYVFCEISFQFCFHGTEKIWVDTALYSEISSGSSQFL